MTKLLKIALICAIAAPQLAPAQMLAPVRNSRMTCTQQINPAGSLVMQLPERHGGDLGIRKPNGELLLIAFDQPQASSTFQPIITTSAFQKMQKLELPVNEIFGINIKTLAKERVFNDAGRYKIYVAPSLETEDPSLDGWCGVDYSPSSTGPTAPPNVNREVVRCNSRAQNRVAAQTLCAHEVRISGDAAKARLLKDGKQVLRVSAPNITCAPMTWVGYACRGSAAVEWTP